MNRALPTRTFDPDIICKVIQYTHPVLVSRNTTFGSCCSCSFVPAVMCQRNLPADGDALGICREHGSRGAVRPQLVRSCGL
jgi:hypothetical protein